MFCVHGPACREQLHRAREKIIVARFWSIRCHTSPHDAWQSRQIDALRVGRNRHTQTCFINFCRGIKAQCGEWTENFKIFRANIFSQIQRSCRASIGIGRILGPNRNVGSSGVLGPCKMERRNCAPLSHAHCMPTHAYTCCYLSSTCRYLSSHAISAHMLTTHAHYTCYFLLFGTL